MFCFTVCIVYYVNKPIDKKTPIMQDDDYAIISVEKETTNQMESEFMFMIEFPL